MWRFFYKQLVFCSFFIRSASIVSWTVNIFGSRRAFPAEPTGSTGKRENKSVTSVKQLFPIKKNPTLRFRQFISKNYSPFIYASSNVPMHPFEERITSQPWQLIASTDKRPEMLPKTGGLLTDGNVHKFPFDNDRRLIPSSRFFFNRLKCTNVMYTLQSNITQN